MCRIAHVCCTVHIRHSGRRRVGRQKKIKKKISFLFFELILNESLCIDKMLGNIKISIDRKNHISRQSKFKITLFILSPYQSYSLLDYEGPT